MKGKYLEERGKTMIYNSRKSDFEIIGWALVASQLTMFFLSLFLSLIASQLLYIFSPLERTWNLIEGYIVMFSAIGGAIPMLIVGVKNNSFINILEKREKAWPVQVAFIFFAIMGLQMLTNIAMTPVINFLESSTGVSFTEANAVATSHSVSSSMMLYSIIIAPIIEELLYRGVLLRTLERYGKWFAIIISALVFGLMHGNAVQFPVAFVIGLLFGYLTLKYSIGLSITLHILNNLSVEIIGRISAFSENMGVLINFSVLIAGIITIFLMIMSAGKPVLKDIKQNRTAKGVYSSFFTCKPVIAVFIYMIALTISSVLI